MASMEFLIKLTMTCCNWTRLPLTSGKLSSLQGWRRSQDGGRTPPWEGGAVDRALLAFFRKALWYVSEPKFSGGPRAICYFVNIGLFGAVGGGAAAGESTKVTHAF